MEESKENPFFSSDSPQRVKVFCLNEDRKWEDYGTGHVSVDNLEKPDGPGLFVFDEDNDETILLHRISPYVEYEKEEDTIISWKDQEQVTEIALSFQESAGRSYIWDAIYNAQRNLYAIYNAQRNLESTINNDSFDDGNNEEVQEFLNIEQSTLPKILEVSLAEETWSHSVGRKPESIVEPALQDHQSSSSSQGSTVT